MCVYILESLFIDPLHILFLSSSSYFFIILRRDSYALRLPVCCDSRVHLSVCFQLLSCCFDKSAITVFFSSCCQPVVNFIFSLLVFLFLVFSFVSFAFSSRSTSTHSVDREIQSLEFRDNLLGMDVASS